MKLEQSQVINSLYKKIKFQEQRKISTYKSLYIKCWKKLTKFLGRKKWREKIHTSRTKVIIEKKTNL